MTQHCTNAFTPRVIPPRKCTLCSNRHDVCERHHYAASSANTSPHPKNPSSFISIILYFQKSIFALRRRPLRPSTSQRLHRHRFADAATATDIPTAIKRSDPSHAPQTANAPLPTYILTAKKLSKPQRPHKSPTPPRPLTIQSTPYGSTCPPFAASAEWYATNAPSAIVNRDIGFTTSPNESKVSKPLTPSKSLTE